LDAGGGGGAALTPLNFECEPTGGGGGGAAPTLGRGGFEVCAENPFIFVDVLPLGGGGGTAELATGDFITLVGENGEAKRGEPTPIGFEGVFCNAGVMFALTCGGGPDDL